MTYKYLVIDCVEVDKVLDVIKTYKLMSKVNGAARATIYNWAACDWDKRFKRVDSKLFIPFLSSVRNIVNQLELPLDLDRMVCSEATKLCSNMKEREFRTWNRRKSSAKSGATGALRFEIYGDNDAILDAQSYTLCRYEQSVEVLDPKLFELRGLIQSPSPFPTVSLHWPHLKDCPLVVGWLRTDNLTLGFTGQTRHGQFIGHVTTPDATSTSVNCFFEIDDSPIVEC